MKPSSSPYCVAQTHFSVLDTALDIRRLGLTIERRPTRCEVVTPEIVNRGLANAAGREVILERAA